MRVQTLDNGAPGGLFTVGDESGHEDWRMLLAVYGHMMITRLRSEVVEYREPKILRFEGAGT